MRALVKRMLSYDAPPLVQFVKYAFVGAVTAVINIAVAEVFAAWVMPCLAADDILVRKLGFPMAALSDSARAARAVGCNLIGFAVANVVCWLLDRSFVFRPGRHHWTLELVLFFCGSALAVLVGNAVIYLLIRVNGTQTTWAFLINIVASVLVNYVVRKFFVFKG